MGGGRASSGGRNAAARAGGGGGTDTPDEMSVKEASGLVSAVSGKLTDAEKEALSKYAKGSDELVNNTLRGLRKNDSTQAAEAKQLTKDLKSAMDKSTGLKRETTLYRGVGKDAVKDLIRGMGGGEIV